MQNEIGLNDYVVGEENVIKSISLVLEDIESEELKMQVIEQKLIDQMHFEYLDKEIHFVSGVYYEWNVAGLIEISFREEANEQLETLFEDLEDGMRVEHITLHYSNGESVSFIADSKFKNSGYQETDIVNGCFVLTIKDKVNMNLLS